MTRSLYLKKLDKIVKEIPYRRRPGRSKGDKNKRKGSHPRKEKLYKSGQKKQQRHMITLRVINGVYFAT